MTKPLIPPKKIAIMGHPDIPEALKVAKNVRQFLEAQGVEAHAGSLYDEGFRKSIQKNEFDLLIALGGDGTMLRAGHLCAPVDVPLLGINVGHFGFLVELNRKEWRNILPRLLTGDFRYEERMMLKAHCVRDGEEETISDVINDVVVARGQYVRPIEVDAFLDGSFITGYVADGLIAATPTGSTAYALAAGGPILPPEIRNILLMPVAPHLSIDRAIVLSEGASVFIRVKTKHEAVVSVDGKEPVHLSSGDGVRIHTNEKSLKMVRFEDPGYFYRHLTMHMEQNPLFGKRINGQSD
ncbi:MAG: NAD(+)/NADH kinase [Brevefilum sp.]|nr:NAD(+)/NADH kinase [Brevefilum sp.]MDT8381794.1 NAD(+)/NADH kinase [Brevefilum sp.]MDW7753790.1 NAD(+)/NADH kinase [Brevefilum sp.]